MTDPLDPKQFKAALTTVTEQPGPKSDGSSKHKTAVRLNARSWAVLKAVAEAEGTTASQVLDLALELFLAKYAAGEVGVLLAGRKQPCSSPAYRWNLKAGVGKATIAALAEREDLAQLLSLL